ncbi:MAG TPA: adenylate/guanylate cyclase domain-containing protein [Anaerolineales bacterium]
MIETNTPPSAPTTLTFLFTDLEGSTRLWQQYPQAMKTALARHDELLRAAVEGCNGQVVKTTGDGFHAAFSSAQDGLSACIHAQRSLLGETWGETGPLRVRMGLHIGDAQHRGGDYYGTAVNRAARLMSAANGGQVLLSAAAASIVADQLPDGVSLRDLGEHRLKDLQRPEHVFQLVHPGLPADFPAIASLNRLPNNLPSQPTVFVGRGAELGEITDILVSDTVRLLTLIGPGGTGKTRLALQTCAELIDRFDDGMYFIDLAPIRDPNSVLATIARTLGLSESSNGSMLDDLKGQLRDKIMLLLLDNFEQVTAAAVQVAELLRFCPRLKLLVTSREALRIRGEHLYPVRPLGLPEVDLRSATPEELARYEAVQLFLDRAQAVKPNFELTGENAEAIAEICQRLDGLPLAIELAAARVRLFSARALRQRLGSRFKLLQGGARDLPARQQTLRHTIDWSYELLAAPEKTLFAVVSLFSGCTFDAVEAVAGGIERLGESEVDVLEGLASLIDKSLIRLSDDGAGEPRLKMLETIREYATERLKADPELHRAACQAHAAYFADFAQRQWRRLAGYEREAAMEEMTADVENLEIAWRHWVAGADLEQLHKMVNGLWLLYDGRGWYQATVELTTDLLDILSNTPSSPEQARQEIMLQTSLARALMAIKGYTPEVEQAYNRALELSQGQGEIPQLFPVLRGLSSYYMYRAEFDKGAQMGARILELAESQDDDYLRIHGYLLMGANTGFRFGYREGLEMLDKGIALFERERHSLRPFQLGNNPGIVCYTTSAFFLWWLGYLDRAVDRADRAIELATALNHPFTMAYALFHTGTLHLWRGDIALAQERARAMLGMVEEHGFQIWESLATMLLGATQMALGQPEEGLAKIEQGFERYQGLKTPPVFFPQLIEMRASAFAQTGQPAAGLRLIDALLKDVEEERWLRDLPPLLLLKGELLLAVSPEDAAEAAGIFRVILDGARQVGGKLLALQAATKLCKLEIRAGKTEESGRVLAEIYAGFTEGLETADLREARAVLDEWQG